ncbi:bacitracin ABC transporter ATP-binding protein [Candidatus Epulonipiscioides gigas]|nr:bacitracin ABC transporter ATP-binding protein [Epulopiscium sp. SCG-C07WGA-EpuloA2]
MQVLNIKDLTKVYGKGKASTIALNNINLDINEKDFIAVMGASGSGKSTLLNLISTIDSPTSGEIYIDGINISKLRASKADKFRKEKLGFIFQDFRLMDSLSVIENISVPLIIQNKSKAEIKQKVSNIMELLFISDLQNKYPYELSGGQKQRTACARAIVSSPKLILADEPTGALDSNNARNIMDILEKINSELAATVMVVTHDPLSASYCKKVIFLKDGQIINILDRTNQDRKQFYKEIIENNLAIQQELTSGEKEVI